MQERCKIGVVIGNANSPHAINIMKGIDQASKECDGPSRNTCCYIKRLKGG